MAAIGAQGRAHGRKLAWTEELFLEERRAAGEALRAANPGGGNERRLDLIRAAIAALAGDDTPRGRLRRYIHVVYGLVHHEKHGGLHVGEADKLVDLGIAILRAQGIEPKRSRLARLYGDLHLIRGQIHRNDGEPWDAAWEQQIAAYMSGPAPSGGAEFQQVAAASRLLRLGHAAAALERFDAALVGALAPGERPRTALLRAQTLMLSGERAAAAGALTMLEHESGLPAGVADEIAWQRLVLDALATGDATALVKGTRRGGRHFQASYVVEACMWAHAVESRTALALLPSLRYLRRQPALELAAQGPWLAAAEAFTDAQDAGIPLPLRLRAVSACLKARERLVTVDKELLLWAAAWRWLRRARVTEAARLAQCEYEGLSLRLSGGRNLDVLGFFSGDR